MVRWLSLLLAVPMSAMVLAACSGSAAGDPTVGGSPTAGAATVGLAKGACEDVTTYDDNWDNDMLCTRSDGTTFYTDYEGAEQFETSGIGEPARADLTAAAPEAGKCEDVTTYDYDWDNDMLCTRPDGSVFYTDYEGAERFERSGEE
jgi:hypothetical protein